tara:strand:- start:1510 stop:2283 length:774 start_codon:yes stop_codon:yes gene_type:complete
LNKLSKEEIISFLNYKSNQYNNIKFIETDPIQIPHLFNKKEDVEISGFLTSTISWGNRKSIIKSAEKLIELLDHSPYDFILNHKKRDLDTLKPFVHRTFNGIDLIQFVKSLKHIYRNYNGLEEIFRNNIKDDSLQYAIHKMKKIFFEIPHTNRTKKHISDPMRGSAAKRINMFLRWMVRDDTRGVDFGIWKSISPRYLSCPLDVHTGNVARKLGLIQRKQNDHKAVMELDKKLREFDLIDPVKYDFALFGLGVFEKF